MNFFRNLEKPIVEVDTNSESEYDLVSDWGEPVPCDLYDNASTRSSEGSEFEHESKGSTDFLFFSILNIWRHSLEMWTPS